MRGANGEEITHVVKKACPITLLLAGICLVFDVISLGLAAFGAKPSLVLLMWLIATKTGTLQTMISLLCCSNCDLYSSFLAPGML